MSETLKKCYVVIYFLYSHQWTPYLVSYSTICLVSPRIKGSKCHYIWQKQQPITKLLVLILLLSYFEHVIISFDIWNFHEFWGRIFIRYSNDGESWDYHLQNIFVELFLPRYQIINLHSCLFLNFILKICCLVIFWKKCVICESYLLKWTMSIELMTFIIKLIWKVGENSYQNIR